MTPQISVQLYSLRDPLSADFEGTIRKLADMGFACVEPAGMHGEGPAAAAKLYKELGITAPTAHCPLPLGDNKNKVIETALELGHKYIIPGVPPGFPDCMKTVDGVKATTELFCEAAANAAEHGLLVGYHNHDADIPELEDGRRAHQLFLELTPETVLWEADIFWVARAGIDPVEFLKDIGPRGRALHFKDGHVNDREAEFPFLPAGTGDVDLKAASAEAKHAEYIVVELDRYDKDMIEAVQQSYTYLTQSGIARGNK
ncbi:sugar phosphate isomerase/epimerase family protein [Coraliomargarita parva]|uniref:sugar phosphate isomerase/epimerase family protein n=1 Tax=Coraliomargarita parva TaxID=3014050 RepID=UPI0022B508EF|nr:sugar phosphate isomerase/epimerase [Coraliomargarita parva]